jgi:hypothetical protein
MPNGDLGRVESGNLGAIEAAPIVTMDHGTASFRVF